MSHPFFLADYHFLYIQVIKVIARSLTAEKVRL